MGPSSRDNGWSGWPWDARQDSQGNDEYDFNYEHGSNAPGAVQQTAMPRAGNDVESLANTFGDVSLGSRESSSYTREGAYTYGASVPAGNAAPVVAYGTYSAQGYAVPAVAYDTSSAQGHAVPAVAYGTSSAQGHAAVAHKGKAKPVDQPAKAKPHRHREIPKERNSSKKHKPKPEKSHAEGYPDDPPPFYPKLGAQSGSNYAASAKPAYMNAEAQPEPGYRDPSQYSAFVPGPAPGSGAAYGYDQGLSAHDNAEAEFPAPWQYASPEPAPIPAAAGHLGAGHEDSPTEQQPSGYYASASDSHAQDEPSEQLQVAMSQSNPYMTGAPDPAYFGAGPSSAMAADACSFEAYGGRATPRPGGADASHQYSDHATGTHSIGRETDRFSEYVLEHSSRFQPGEVFKILWCEPLGSGPPRSEIITNWVGVQENGRQFYQGLRRFIVVANDEGHCTCVPILTYEHKACTKKGVKPSKHGIVYQSGKRPRLVDGEPQLGFPPVRVELYERTEKLDRESRVNYAKLTTVEHNFRVYFIGRVANDDFVRIVSPAVDQCWNKKKRH